MAEDKKQLIMKGTVISNAMDKTIVVAVDTFKTHRKYLKKYLSTKKYKAHDPENSFEVGDTVKIVQSRPMSKGKKFKVIE